MKVRNVKREKEKKYNYVYKLTLKNDERYFYIGKRSTNNEDDSSYLGSGHGLREYKEKYGKDCFNKEILSYWDTAEEALEEEAKIVTKDLIKDKFCLNRIEGGGCFDFTGCIRGKSSPSAVRKNSESHKGLKQTKETRQKRSEKIREKWKDPQYREAQKTGRAGKYDDHLKKLSQEREGKLCIIKNGKWKYINKDEFDTYKNDGWERRGIQDKISIDEISKLRNNGLSYSKIGEMYGVNESCIRHIYNKNKQE